MELQKKTEEFTKKYEQYKSIVLKWEIAFSKEKGKQPTRDDFSVAPRVVRLAYRTYLQIKHLLSKLSSNGTDVEHLKKRKPIESPRKIFRKYISTGENSRDGLIEVFNPPPKVRSDPTMGGIIPLSPSANKIQPLLAATEDARNIRFTTPHSRKKSNEDDENGLPFGKLNSKLFVQEIAAESLPIPVGNLTDEFEDKEEDLNFPFEIEKILLDVKRAVESFDMEDFDDDGSRGSVTMDSALIGGFGDVLEPTLSSFMSTPLSIPSVAILPAIEVADNTNTQNTHSFFSRKSSTKPRTVTGRWIDRCHLIAGDDDVVVPEKLNSETEVGVAVASRTKSVKLKTPTEVPALKRKAEEITDFDFLDEQAVNPGSKKGRKRIRLTPKPSREKKINDNFVRVDVTKKVFVRGRKKMTGFQHKRLDWKLKKSQAVAEQKSQLTKCKKCREVGHFAKFCVKELQRQNEVKPEEVDDSPFPSLEEVARMISSKKALEASHTRTCIYEHSQSQRFEMETGQGRGEAETESATSFQSTGGNEDQEYEPTLVLVSHDDDDETYSPSSEAMKSRNEFNQTASSGFVLNASDNAGVASQALAEVNFLLIPAFPNASFGPEDEEILQEALKLFGYNDFRPGQKEAITRVLLGQSTLVVLSTGCGKSLCYLLPAYIYAKKYPGVLTICVSPLVSLMEDQVQSLPPFLEGACLHTNMSVKQRELVIEKIRQKKLQVLLASPEAICGDLFGLLRNVHEFPTVAFACVDEVHCVSEWSHNFRPSYFRLCQILRDRLNVKTILGLTATATNHTIRSVCDHLCLDPSTVVKGEIIPSNLRLSCSRDMNREDALIMLLRSKRFEECDSIIIYCTRREQCERIATLIRTTQHNQFSAIIKENSRRRISTDCEAYHAGMSAARRKSVQKNFMAGKIRIVVATVAFGMGIDKPNIRAVIHYNMPKSFESFVQEIGRAGRDGLPAECHLFLDNNKGKDICELKRYIYSNSVDRSILRKLLSRIFRSCTCQRAVKIKGIMPGDEQQGKSCSGHEVSFSIDATVRDLDLPVENIDTLLCYLERYSTDRKFIEVLPKCYHLCSIQSYGGTNLLKSSARTCAALGAAIAMQKEKKKFKDDDVHLSFNFVEVARLLGWPSAQTRRELKSLEWTGTEFDEAGNPIKFRKSGLLIEFSDLAYRLMTPGALSDEESDKILNFLHERNVDQERMELFQLNRVYQSLFSNSCKSVESLCESYDQAKSDNLKELILEYFSNSDVGVPVGWKPPMSGSNAEKEETIRQDVRKLLQSNRDQEFSSRSIARIFQGISSPCFPSEDWCRNRAFWRRHLDVDFPFLCQIAAQELVS